MAGLAANGEAEMERHRMICRECGHDFFSAIEECPNCGDADVFVLSAERFYRQEVES